jgi:nucleoside-diphosphate-sugar epimerase
MIDLIVHPHHRFTGSFAPLLPLLGQPVRGHSSDNTPIKKLMSWEPDTKLKDGLKKTYDWILGELKV